MLKLHEAFKIRQAKVLLVQMPTGVSISHPRGRAGARDVSGVQLQQLHKKISHYENRRAVLALRMERAAS
jgi:hypothetical protein